MKDDIWIWPEGMTGQAFLERAVALLAWRGCEVVSSSVGQHGRLEILLGNGLDRIAVVCLSPGQRQGGAGDIMRAESLSRAATHAVIILPGSRGWLLNYAPRAVVFARGSADTSAAVATSLGLPAD